MFELGRDPARGVVTLGRFQPDGKIYAWTLQYTPDRFFDQVSYLRDNQDMKHHRRLVSMMPDTMKTKLLVDGNGKPFDLRDPDREKKQREIDNNIDYRKFRVWEGRV